MFHERFLKKMIWKSPKLIRRLKDTLGLQQGLIMFMTHGACLHHFPKTNRLKMVTGWSRCSWILSATLTNSTGTEAGEFSNYQLCSWKNGMAHDYIFFMAWRMITYFSKTYRFEMVLGWLSCPRTPSATLSGSTLGTGSTASTNYVYVFEQ